MLTADRARSHFTTSAYVFVCLSRPPSSKKRTFFVHCLCFWKLFSVTCPYIHADHCIDGKEFLDLSEAEIKEIVPPFGIAKQIIRLQPKVIKFVVCVSAIVKILS